MTPSERLRLFAHELAAIARTGLTFSSDAYDVERYERVARIAEGLAALGGDEEFTPERPFLPDVGYVTPKVGTAFVARDGEGRVAVVRRADNGKWALPGGFCEVGASPGENALRELAEEAGLVAGIDAFLGVYDNRHFASTSPYHVYGLCFAGRITGGEPRPSRETPEVRLVDPADLPEPMVASHRAVVARAVRGERGILL